MLQALSDKCLAGLPLLQRGRLEIAEEQLARVELQGSSNSHPEGGHLEFTLSYSSDSGPDKTGQQHQLPTVLC